MIRLFTKNATGVAPDGRWYPGDINALQDAVAAINDLTQTLGVGTIQLGETGLQFLRYGAGEARLTGDIRMDGIVRSLGGELAGAFTTTQRDAIAAGRRPYGLKILNTTTNRYEWNSGTDAAPVWISLSGIEVLEGTFAARPAANTVRAGTLYHSTDTAAMYRSDGSTWTLVGLHPDGSGNYSIGGNYRAESGGFRVQRHPYVNERHMESGVVLVTNNTFASVSFTNAFASAPIVVGSAVYTDPTSNGGHVVNSITTTGFQISQNTGAATLNMNWIAEGVD